MNHSKRVKLTKSCRDSEYIPKVKDSGGVEYIDNTKCQIMHNGVKVIYGGYHGDWMAEIIKDLHGHHEPQEEKVFYEILKQIKNNATMLELGSYWGYYSAWFNKEIEGARNYLVEPNPAKLEIGKKNFALNNMDGNFFNAYVGEISRERSAFVDWDGKEYPLPMVCIDDFLHEQDISFLDILHSDIQGAELDMLKGAKKSLGELKIGFVVLSTHGDRHEPCRILLSDYGYRMIAAHTPHESASADGLLVMQSPLLQEIPPVSITKNKENLFDKFIRFVSYNIRKITGSG